MINRLGIKVPRIVAKDIQTLLVSKPSTKWCLVPYFDDMEEDKEITTFHLDTNWNEIQLNLWLSKLSLTGMSWEFETFSRTDKFRNTVTGRFTGETGDSY